MTSNQQGVSVRIFLVNGRPDGLKIVEKSNWTGRAVMCGRAQYPDVRDRDEFAKPGVYLLIAPSEDAGNRHRIYIGQADNARSRLDQHFRDRDFWTHVILFTSKDENLNRAHVQYIEARLIERAHTAKQADIENGNLPNRPKLSEADVADVESFLADMFLIYPLLGVNAFETVHVKPRVQPESLSDETGHEMRPSRAQTREKTPLLFLRGLGAQAQGYDSPEGFIVLQGAKARADEVPSIHRFMSDLRIKMKKDGLFSESPDGLLLTQDYLFSSPTTAAGVLLGRAANGRLDWKDESGRTLKQIQESSIPI